MYLNFFLLVEATRNPTHTYSNSAGCSADTGAATLLMTGFGSSWTETECARRKHRDRRTDRGEQIGRGGSAATDSAPLNVDFEYASVVGALVSAMPVTRRSPWPVVYSRPPPHRTTKVNKYKRSTNLLIQITQMVETCSTTQRLQPSNTRLFTANDVNSSIFTFSKQATRAMLGKKRRFQSLCYRNSIQYLNMEYWKFLTSASIGHISCYSYLF